MSRILQKKVCLLGDFAVGKTSLIRRFVEGRFDEKYLSTIGVTVSRKIIDRADHQLKLLIWDLAGGEKFSRYQLNYLRGAAGAMVVMDLTRPESLVSLAGYASQLIDISPNARLVFVGNKSDLSNKTNPSLIGLHDVSSGFQCPHHLTSAKTGEHVEAAFNDLADLIEAVK